MSECVIVARLSACRQAFIFFDICYCYVTGRSTRCSSKPAAIHRVPGPVVAAT